MFSKLFLSAVVVIGLAGCAIGAMTPPVNKEIRTTPSMYDANFSAAVRTMNSLGTVTGSDKSEGYVNGLTSMNIKVTVQLAKDGTVKVNAQLPGDKFLMGTTLDKEVEKIMSALQPALK